MKKDVLDERLSKKASSLDYGSLRREMADLREALGPLIDRRIILDSIIDKVIQLEVKGNNERDFRMLID